MGDLKPLPGSIDSPREPFSWKRTAPSSVTLAVLGLGTLLLVGVFFQLRSFRKAAQNQWGVLRRSETELAPMLFHYETLEDLRRSDIAKSKDDLLNQTHSKRTMFETGLSLQEEKRLLEKQWEILTTSILVDGETQRVVLRRADRPLGSFRATIPPQALGDITERLPNAVRVISKERFAHPERGQSREVNGQIIYEPPQVGTSVRSNALGEFVIFTNSRLILHGPPLQPEKHDQFPHYCLQLSQETAQRLYRESFIGTVISLPAASAETSTMGSL